MPFDIERFKELSPEAQKIVFDRKGVSPAAREIIMRRISATPETTVPKETSEPNILQRLNKDFQERGAHIYDVTQRHSAPVAGALALSEGAQALGFDVPGEVLKSAGTAAMKLPFLRERVNDWKTGAGILAQQHPGVVKGLQKAAQGYENLPPEARDIVRGAGGLLALTPAEQTLALPKYGAKAARGLGAAGKEGSAIVGDVGRLITQKSPEIVDPMIDNVIRSDFKKIATPPISSTGKTLAGIKRYTNNTVKGIREILNNKKNLIYETDKGIISGKLPKNLRQLAEAIGQTKRSLYNKYHSITEAADAAGVTIPLNGVVRVLRNRANNIPLRLRHPEVVKKLEDLADRYEAQGALSALDAEEAMNQINNEIKNFRKNPQYELTSVASIDDAVGKEMRDVLNKVLGKEYKDAREAYGALLNFESDVARKVLPKEELKKLPLDITDMYGVYAGVRGLLHLDPAVLAGVGTATALKNRLRIGRDPNLLVDKMFSKLGKLEESKSPAFKSKTASIPEILRQRKLKKSIPGLHAEALVINAIGDRLNQIPGTPLLDYKPGWFSMSSDLPYTNLPDRAAPIKRPYQGPPTILGGAQGTKVSVPDELRALSSIPGFLRTPEQMARLKELQQGVQGLSVEQGLRGQTDIPNRDVILKDLLRPKVPMAGEPLPRDITAGKHPGKLISEILPEKGPKIRRNYLRIKSIQKWFFNLPKSQRADMLDQLSGKVPVYAPNKLIRKRLVETRKWLESLGPEERRNVMKQLEEGKGMPQPEKIAPAAKEGGKTVSAVGEGAPAAKKPWQMTMEELGNNYDNKWSPGIMHPAPYYGLSTEMVEKAAKTLPDTADKWRVYHKAVIMKALSEGKPVPPEVLKDYPELLKRKRRKK